MWMLNGHNNVTKSPSGYGQVIVFFFVISIETYSYLHYLTENVLINKAAYSSVCQIWSSANVFISLYFQPPTNVKSLQPCWVQLTMRWTKTVTKRPSGYGRFIAFFFFFFVISNETYSYLRYLTENVLIGDVFVTYQKQLVILYEVWCCQWSERASHPWSVWQRECRGNIWPDHGMSTTVSCWPTWC